jgi:hypothetical protein
MITEAVLKVYDKIFRDVTSKLAMTALTLSLLSIAVIWVLFAASIKVGGGSWTVQISQLGVIPAAIFITIFIITFLVVWFILYIQYMKESEDIYSHLRQKLEGSWTAYYDYTIAGKYIFPTRPRALFKFEINKEKKLEMLFDPKDNILFSDVDQDVSQISLRHISSNKYSLMYFFHETRVIAENISDSIEPEYSNHNVREIDVEVFGVLNFEEPNGQQNVIEMSGCWYDLNGNMRTLGMLLRERARAEVNGALKEFKVKLSSLGDNHSVSAKMGEINFRRN